MSYTHMSRTYVAVDVETTGLDPYEDAIIEVAAVVFDNGETLEEWSSLVDPGRKIPAFITRLTGISNEMVADAPSLFSLRGNLRRLMADRIIVGHNVGFDMGFLEQENIGLNQPRLDTLTLASILLPSQGRYGLVELARRLGLGAEKEAAQEPSHHRALSDARHTAALFRTLYERALKLDYWQLTEIVEAGRRIGWPETSFFQDALRQVARQAFGQSDRVRRLFKPPKLDGHTLNPREDLEPVDAEVVCDMLKPGGNFSRVFPGYEYRPQQVEMVQAVAQAFNNGEHTIVEAGTGTGKSIGYLLPAAFWAHQNERCVVVSTNTINLQDQLINKDLPELRKLLPFELRATILKGKRNYLCTRLFQQMRHSGPTNAEEMALYARILLWLPRTKTGDVNEISLRNVGEQIAWNRLSADNDTCRMNTCLEERCPLHMARRRAEQAHVLVVNHALLLADVASGNRVLPSYRDLIVDEAHHLEAAVTDGLSFRGDRRFLESLLEEMTGQRTGLVADLQSRTRAELPPLLSAPIDSYAEKVREAANDAMARMDDFFGTLHYFLQDHVRADSPYSQQVRLTPAVRQQPSWELVEDSWENVAVNFRALVGGLGKLCAGLEEVAGSYDLEDAEDLLAALENLARRLEETTGNMQAIICEPQEEMITWAELYRNRLSLHSAPLNVGPLVEEHLLAEKETVILTSATLRTAGRGGYGDVDFAYLRDRLHAHEANELAVGSPFDYKKNTLLYLVSDMPEPNQPGYQRYVEEAVVEVARAIGGRTMVLFTSFNQLRATARAIEQALSEADISLLAQGDGASRQHLLEEFKEVDSRAVLLGTRSFWEGVDVPGIALQAVLIARLPFDVPSDPVFAARSETFDSPFFEYSIPEAVLRFRQGFGRLIRRRDDEGMVVVLDKRVLTKRYGQSFLDALPECTIIRQRHSRLAELTVRWFNRERE
ncbi:MAG: helicase C-terminal domain-containing protein [Chloroflexota bacterium]